MVLVQVQMYFDDSSTGLVKSARVSFNTNSSQWLKHQSKSIHQQIFHNFIQKPVVFFPFLTIGLSAFLLNPVGFRRQPTLISTTDLYNDIVLLSVAKMSDSITTLSKEKYVTTFLEANATALQLTKNCFLFLNDYILKHFVPSYTETFCLYLEMRRENSEEFENSGPAIPLWYSPH